MGLTPGERLSAAIRSLAAVLGIPLSGIIRAVTASEEWDWNNDPYSRGAYSFIAAGQDNASRELAKPVKGTLFFAGEATADGIETGTVHGAFSSGLRAARQVLAAKVKPHGSF
jgi:monoamine oxidase